MGKRAALAVAAVLAVAATLYTACSEQETAASSGFTLAVPAPDPWSGPALPEFELIERSERHVALSQLRGAPFVFDFIFTTCSGPCPLMTRNMRTLQDELAGSDVRLVSFSVDPPTDTPAVLSRYADGFGADKQHWLFLTGDEAQVSKIASAVLLPMQRAPAGEAPIGMQVAHTTRFVVVDAKGVVRGMYDGQTGDGIRAAAARARWLAEHRDR
jgi:cytochrome oxidase Cu insertion factor (SCO1/SenC/PrrC family)